jgi:hypothetical protein
MRWGYFLLRVVQSKIGRSRIGPIVSFPRLSGNTSRSSTVPQRWTSDAVDTAHFSLPLSIRTTTAAGLLGGYDLARPGDVALQGDAVLAGMLAFASALAAIAGLMAWL